MSGPSSIVEDIFLAALEKGTPEERAAYVNAACKADAELRRRVERLLEAHPKAGGFLEGPARPFGEETAACVRAGEHIGFVIAGRYKLVEQIGEGGMGTVWVAEQTQPVRRKVALKLIKAGMDSRTVLSRFDAERQALALMDHPNIAKVLDGGTTESGRPFFVMEYVKGIPFTTYCDDARLSIAERLALFVPVCQAVQHAHQKGIIHRDLKPSNILICLYDGKPVPKVIDFGLAKAIHQPLTEYTLHTAHGLMMGTPLYMSPEQAEFNNLDVDTRTDIYALGVILYELLTGTTPLEKQRFRRAAWEEMLRLIKEEEPQRPSARLSGSGTLPSLAAQRQVEPVKLASAVRGELDWIVMKCLEKDRSRRYDSATGLARDVERYLADDVVEARPMSAAYRLRKFARKHRVAITTASAFAALLLAAAGISAALAAKARAAERLAETRRIDAEANAAKAGANAVEARQNADAWLRASAQHFGAVVDAEMRTLGLSVDLGLAEARNDPRIGLLQLARPLHVSGQMPHDGPNFRGTLTVNLDGHPPLVELREFATMAVLATGQAYAPLLPPITHDGQRVVSSLLNSKGDRLLTRGADKSARLWDAFTGRQIATLRRDDEMVIEVGLSPNGDTAFTHSLDGVARFWETRNGTFRAATEPRPGRIKLTVIGSSDPFAEAVTASPGMRAATQLSNDRLMTSSTVIELKRAADIPSVSQESTGPVELWDAKNGRWIARLELPALNAAECRFFDSGRWIEATKLGDPQALHVFSAETGRPVAELRPADAGLSASTTSLIASVSPGGRTAATVAQVADGTCYVCCWDTTSWRLSSVTGPLRGLGGPGAADSLGGNLGLRLLADDQFAASVEGAPNGIYRSGTATPLAQLPDRPLLFQGDRVVVASGQLFDTGTWRRLQPPNEDVWIDRNGSSVRITAPERPLNPKPRKYHPELARFAPDGRFLQLGADPGFIDAAADKAFGYHGDAHFRPGLGWVMMETDTGRESEYVVRLHRLPPLDHLAIPPDLLELWAQVAVRGQLDDQGAFVKWDEPTWEMKRQELAARPAPFPDFPFPGHVATDRLHSLREEYVDAKPTEKRRIASRLLDRAETAGDNVEAVRWRAILAADAHRPPQPPAP